METIYTSSGRAELAITQWGSEGAPIVALHPGVGDSRIWRGCAPAWAEAGYRIVGFDRRGFGDTRYHEEPHDDLADLLTVTTATNTRPAVIVGNSLGGGLALDLALAHPEHVSGLVLIAPSASGYPVDDWPITSTEARQDELMERAEESGDLELVNRLTIRYWLDGVEQPEGRVHGPERDLMIDMNARALHAEPIGEVAQRTPAWPLLGQVNAPTLIIAGEHDLPGIGLLCTRLTAALPNARLTMIKDTCHCPSLDQPDALNEAVLEFLSDVAGS